VELGSAIFPTGRWLPVVPLVIAGAVSMALVSMALEVLERSERRQVVGLFSRFLRPSVAEEIWRQRDEFMGGDHHRAPSRRGSLTALMSDLYAFTTLSEQMEPETLMAWVSEYMDAMAEVVEDHQGVVDDYAGDGIKANFGFPVLSEGKDEIAADAVRAVSCALAMGRRMVQLNESWKRRKLPVGRCRVGVYTGPTVVGCIGSEKSLKYTSVGNTINTAARLQDFHKEELVADQQEQPWRVLIGGETLCHLDGAFQVEDLGLHRLEGKSDEIHIYKVLGEGKVQ
jgi:adenylate cyclase